MLQKQTDGKMLDLAGQISDAETDVEHILLMRGRFRRGCDEMLTAARRWFAQALLQGKDVQLQFAEYGLRALAARAQLMQKGLKAAADRERMRQPEAATAEHDEATVQHHLEQVAAGEEDSSELSGTAASEPALAVSRS